MPDVLIVGAGPAGISASIHLARAGRKVLVIDKATFPRDKCCGDGLTTNALRRLEAIGFDPRKLDSWSEVQSSVFCSPKGERVTLDIDTSDGIRIGVVRREELDAALVDFARSNGVNILEATTVESVADQGRKVRVRLSNGTDVDTDYVIGADGMWSPLRHLIEGSENTRYLGDIHAFRQYFTNVTGTAREQLCVWFEPDILPGYVWSFPAGNGTANVGFGVQRKPGESVAWMKDAWADIVNRPHIREALGAEATAESTHKAWPIPARISAPLLSSLHGRVLYIGDAARVVDPLTGEGIGQALETGEMAADAIIHAGIANPRRAARLYSNSLMTGMALDNKFAASLAKIVRHEPLANTVIHLAPRGPWKGRYAMKWAFEDNPRAALLTPWRWPERFKHKTGAFKGE